MLADCLREGTGVGRDPVRAVPLLASAADKGHRNARKILLDMLVGAQCPGRGARLAGVMCTRTLHAVLWGGRTGRPP